MNAPPPMVISYHTISPPARAASRLLRGWAGFNWFSAALAVGIVTFLVRWPAARAFAPGNAFLGMIVYTIGGCFAVGTIAWGALCWSLANGVLVSDFRSIRIAQLLTLLLATGCALSTLGLLLLRTHYGRLYWHGAEGWAWCILFASTTPFILATLLTTLMLQRAVTFDKAETQKPPQQP